ncbi:MAG: sigma-70 family RNA polymerase sigma factor [Verrucomicrobia bacterium]|nr:sigma-70 family RNA polymerase sigma factor [Verrucomicrobiota bacterium]
MTSAKPPPNGSGARGAFPTTHWSIVLSARSLDAPAARAALESLCRQYWYPIYAFVRRQGRGHHEAEDLTQALFARLLDADAFASARPERGRFRTFLLGATINFLTDEWRRAHAQKRGGGREPAPLPIAGAEQRFAAEPVDPGLTPEAAFDRAWALEMIERALAGLRLEYEAGGRGALYAAVARHVWSDGAAKSQATAAQELGMNEHAFTVAVSRLRQRLRERLRAEVMATVVRESEAADELRHLMAAVRAKVR